MPSCKMNARELEQWSNAVPICMKIILDLETAIFCVYVVFSIISHLVVLSRLFQLKTQYHATQFFTLHVYMSNMCVV
jgi:hypothetical protein